jgi:plasmid stability protein
LLSLHAFGLHCRRNERKQGDMGQLTVRKIDDEIIRRLKIRAAQHGRSAEAEHREILKQALLAGEEGGRRGVAPARQGAPRTHRAHHERQHGDHSQDAG